MHHKYVAILFRHLEATQWLIGINYKVRTKEQVNQSLGKLQNI